MSDYFNGLGEAIACLLILTEADQRYMELLDKYEGLERKYWEQEARMNRVQAESCTLQNLLRRALPCVEDHDRAEDSEELGAEIREALG